MALSDKELVLRYRNGDTKSFEVLIGRYMNVMYGFSYRRVRNRAEAEDIVQDVFMRAWKHLPSFDAEKSFKAWMFSIAQNACIDFLRRKRAAVFSDFETAEGKNPIFDTLADSALSPFESAERRDSGRIVSRIRSSLAEKYRTVLSLRYRDDLTFREIASRLGEPLDTVKSRHYRALKMLKKIISGVPDAPNLPSNP